MVLEGRNCCVFIGNFFIPIPPRKWPLHVLFLFHFVIFIKIWEEDLDKDMILD